MKAILYIGAVFAVAIFAAGLILFLPGMIAQGFPIVGLAVLVSGFMFIALLGVLQGIMEIRDLLKTLVTRG